MNKKLFVDGDNCFIQQEILSDESLVYNVFLHNESEIPVSLRCANMTHALRIYEEIETCIGIDVNAPVISHGAEKKIDAFREERKILRKEEINLRNKTDNLTSLLSCSNKEVDSLKARLYACGQRNDSKEGSIDDLREQIGLADEVNDLLRAKNKALSESLYSMWQKKQLAIADLEDKVFERNDTINARNGKIDSLKRGIKELSDRYQESQHHEIRADKELEELKSRIRNLAVDKEDL